MRDHFWRESLVMLLPLGFAIVMLTAFIVIQSIKTPWHFCGSAPRVSRTAWDASVMLRLVLRSRHLMRNRERDAIPFASCKSHRSYWNSNIFNRYPQHSIADWEWTWCIAPRQLGIFFRHTDCFI